MGIDHLSPDKQYELYILEIKTQLKDAKKQAERIPELEKFSQMTYVEWYEIHKHKFETETILPIATKVGFKGYYTAGKKK